MHKIFLFAPLFFFLGTAANDFYDQLDTAINNANLKVVQMLLEQRKLTPSEANKFYALASEYVEFYKTNRVEVPEVQLLLEEARSYRDISVITGVCSLLTGFSSLAALVDGNRIGALGIWPTIILLTIAIYNGNKYGKPLQDAHDLYTLLVNNSVAIKNILAGQIDTPITQKNKGL